MKRLTTIALMVNLAVASAYAQHPVAMGFSGTSGASPINLNQPGTHTVEENVAGNGTLGSFTLRDVRSAALGPQPSTTCTGLFFPSTSGSAVLRFEDGSLLTLSLTQGGDCIDLVHQVGHCTLTFRITGGTGHFKNASGDLTYTETALPVLPDAQSNPVFFTETGEITGSISGVAIRGEFKDEWH
ncbi:MAG: hypothetical protein JWO80_2197 [Bryobacterales bacterium]|nr:hypothetical protein [Bryobacterales bacterium]